MNGNGKFVAVWCAAAVLLWAGMALAATPRSKGSARKPAPVEPAVTKADAATANIPENILRKRNYHVTQAQREAAAEQMKALKTSAAVKGAAGETKAMAATKAMTPVPGGVPDYFGVANWANSPPLRKFVDTLPKLGYANRNNLQQYLSVAVPDTITYPGSDYYEIELRQYTEQLHSDLAPTTLRGYVQVNNGTDQATGLNTAAPSPIRYLGPLIIAQKDRPVRIKFTNKLPTGPDGNLFLPVDTTVMGAGMGPLGGTEFYTQNRADLHLHGGRTPWISDGTPHQWITPVGEVTSYPVGESMTNVPDMPNPGEGSQTYYYSNQQSARLMFYHDHAYGITRLNVYAGEAAGYLIQDAAEKTLVDSGVIPAEQIPLIIQDKSFVDPATVLVTDPTWNWGTTPPTPNAGDLWYPHVYVPAQNPYDVTGVNPFGRWAYGPWFWPPTIVTFPPIPNPYYDPINAPWEPPEMPPCPNPSMPGESFMDTPLVNGTVFPSLTVQPKTYRFRILNAANDRFFNLQMYEADPATVSSDGRTLTEVKMVTAVANPAWPPDWPIDGRAGGVPDPATVGPDWIQIGNEGGFLPAPAVIPNQPVTWNADPTTFNMGNVALHSLLVAPAERADVIVDFSAYAGKTLILYNDAPAAFPARDARLDYYTGAPDLTDTGGHPGPQIGFGPNTRTIMQIKVEAIAPAAAYDIVPLQTAFASTATTQGVFAASQDPIIVGQTAYNSTYNLTFPTTWPLWGYVRIQDSSMQLQTVAGTALTLPLQPKAIHDEMGAAFDADYGRMSGKLGLELSPATAFTQNFVMQGFIDPPTEILVDCISAGAPTAGDGTQIWKITHNGVDTHPIHFHLFDVQLINRVGWDGAIRLPDPNELGWKETVRISPLEDTIVALRPVAPKQPFGIPDSVRPWSVATPIGSPDGFTNLDPLTGDAIIPGILNDIVNFGWEYVWHCHILSHEEMDMMRPIVFNVARALSDTPTLNGTAGANQVFLTWTDPTPWDGTGPLATLGNPANEVGFRIERAVVTGGVAGAFAEVGTALANAVSYNDLTAASQTNYAYRLIAFNAAGDSVPSNIVSVTTQQGPPVEPSALTATASVLSVNPPTVTLNWTDNSLDEAGFQIQRATNAAFTANVATFTVGANVATYIDAAVAANATYYYRVLAYNAFGNSIYATAAPVTTPGILSAAPGVLTATAAGSNQVNLAWTDNSNNEVSFRIERATNAGFTTGLTTFTAAANAVAYNDTTVASNTSYWYRVYAVNAAGTSAASNTATVTTPQGPPLAPSALTATASVLSTNPPTVTLNWMDNSLDEAGFQIQRATNAGFTANLATFNVGANVTTYPDASVAASTAYYYRVRSTNAAGNSTYAVTGPVTTPGILPLAPSALTATTVSSSRINLAWTDNSNNEASFRIQRATNVGFTTGLTTFNTGANAVAYSDTTVASNTSYWYRVYAVNAAGTSAASNAATATTPQAPPTAPSNLTATTSAAGVNPPTVTLAWTDRSNNENGFSIQRATNVQFAGAVTMNAGVNVTTYVDTTVAAGTRYYYRVFAFNAVGNSGYSNMASVTTTTVSVGPAAPSNVRIISAGTNYLSLGWRDNSGNETGFQIQRATNAAGPWTALPALPANSRQYRDNGLTSRTTYYYQVRSVNAAGNSAWTPATPVSGRTR